MTKDTQRKRIFEARSRVIKALGHPTRLCIVDSLAGGEQCVGDLTAVACCDMSTVSKHLSILKSAGIVRDEKRGSSVYYTLTSPRILDFFACSDAVISRMERAV